MKDSGNIRLLLEKYVEGKCSAEEIAEVIAYFKREGNHDEFPDVSFVTSTSELFRVWMPEERIDIPAGTGKAGTIERRQQKGGRIENIWL